MNLSDLQPPKGQNHRRKRVGRGFGSGMGKTATRGENGQKSRAGYSRRPGFEGGQMPLVRRVPKRGFQNIFRKEFAAVNVGRLDELEGDSFNPEVLQKNGVVKKLGDGLKILGNGELTRPLTGAAHRFSASAKEKIEKAGGTVQILSA